MIVRLVRAGRLVLPALVRPAELSGYSLFRLAYANFSFWLFQVHSTTPANFELLLCGGYRTIRGLGVSLGGGILTEPVSQRGFTQGVAGFPLAQRPGDPGGLARGGLQDQGRSIPVQAGCGCYNLVRVDVCRAFEDFP